MSQVLSPADTHRILERFPQIELSYETTPHKKVPPSYNVCLGIPIGKKCFLWFSYLPDDTSSQNGHSTSSQTTGHSTSSHNKCFILEVTKDKKIGKIEMVDFIVDRSIFLGTIFYGTFYSTISEKSEENPMKENRIFLIEDVFFYKGITMKGLVFGEKLGFLEKFFKEYTSKREFSEREYTSKREFSEREYSLKRDPNPFLIRLPTLWYPSINTGKEYDCVYDVPSKYQEFFPIHHIQYRSLTETVPYLNIFPTKKTIGGEKSVVIKSIMDDLILSKPQYRPDLYKPQYKQKATFIVRAEIAFDIYRLYAYGKAKELIFYGIAYIQNPAVSTMMNQIFRKIKENQNLDAIEESDDEEDFENIDFDKYVDLKKSVAMECRFHMKFKKWIPLRIVDSSQKIVHIGNLVADYR